MRHRTTNKRRDITEWTGREQLIQEDFILGPEALYQTTRAEYKTEPDSIKMKDLIRLFSECYIPKQKTYHNRGDFFGAKQTKEETDKEFWRRLVEIEKRKEFQHNVSRKTTDIQAYDGDHR